MEIENFIFAVAYCDDLNFNLGGDIAYINRPVRLRQTFKIIVFETKCNLKKLFDSLSINTNKVI